MKRIYLIRHAKSSWEEAGIADWKRPLLKMGIDRTRKIVQYFLAHSVRFDLMIASHATRAMDTAKIIALGIDYPEDKIVCDKRIYHQDASAYFDILYELENTVSSVALIGHNPVITEFANQYLTEKVMYMPTSAVVCVEFSTDVWTEIHTATPKLCFYIYPKMF